MTEKRKVLGRGLETLLPPRQVPHAPTSVTTAAPSPASHDQPGESLRHVPIDQIDRNPYQTRIVSNDPAALRELTASILAVGVLQPIVVRPVADGRYQVIAGERRWEAARAARLQTIPAVVRSVSNQQAMEMTIIENLQRLDLTPMEEARGYDRLSREFGLTQEQMAQRTGKDRSSVANFLRLLKLPQAVQTLIDIGYLSFGHAKVLMAVESPEALQELAERVVKHSLTVRQTEQAVTNLIHPPETVEKVRTIDPNVKEAEQELQRALGVRVTITDRNGRGKILLEYSSLEDFDRILEVMKAK